MYYWNRTYCHISCISEPSEIKFKKSTGDKVASKQPKKRDIFGNYITFIKSVIQNGNTISLSELRDTLNQNENKIFNNSETKLFITEYFGDSAQLCYSEQKNESMLIFSSKTDIQDVIDKLRSLNA